MNFEMQGKKSQKGGFYPPTCGFWSQLNTIKIHRLFWLDIGQVEYIIPEI
jgi:hypothetical protein